MTTLAKARAKASAKGKHIYNTGVNYDHHLRLSKYFYSKGHWSNFFLHSFKNLVTERAGQDDFKFK
jgi:hypothetical protein